MYMGRSRSFEGNFRVDRREQLKANLEGAVLGLGFIAAWFIGGLDQAGSATGGGVPWTRSASAVAVVLLSVVPAIKGGWDRVKDDATEGAVKLLKEMDFILIPVMDLCNHSSRAATVRMRKSTSRAQYDLVTREIDAATREGEIAPGEELSISYGDVSNDDLLVRFGFVEKDNPYDDFVLSKKELCRLLDIENDRVDEAMLELGLGAAGLDEGVYLQRKAPNSDGSIIYNQGTTLMALGSLPTAFRKGPNEQQQGVAATELVGFKALQYCLLKLLKEIQEGDVKKSSGSSSSSSKTKEAAGASTPSVAADIAVTFRREKARVLKEALRTVNMEVDRQGV